jgi:hypothetical protein
MNIEHCDLLSWVRESRAARKRKNHAQDCETLIAAMPQPQGPAILPWFCCLEWRPSFRWYGHLTRYAQRPDCCWMLLRMNVGETATRLATPCENARNLRA